MKESDIENGLEFLDWIEWSKKYNPFELVRIRKYTDGGILSAPSKKQLFDYYDKENKTHKEHMKADDYSRFHQNLKCRNCKKNQSIIDKKTYYYIVCNGYAATCDIGDSAPMGCEGFIKDD
jgi:hypothetical protein